MSMNMKCWCLKKASWFEYTILLSHKTQRKKTFLPCWTKETPWQQTFPTMENNRFLFLSMFSWHRTGDMCIVEAKIAQSVRHWTKYACEIYFSEVTNSYSLVLVSHPLKNIFFCKNCSGRSFNKLFVCRNPTVPIKNSPTENIFIRTSYFYRL